MDKIIITSIEGRCLARLGRVTGEASTPEQALLLCLMAAGMIDNQITKRLPTEQEIVSTPHLLHRMMELARANDTLEEDLPAPQLNDLMPALDEQIELFASEFPQFEIDWTIVTNIKAVIERTGNNR